MLKACAPPHTNPLDPDAENYIPTPAVITPDWMQARVRSVHTAHAGNLHAYGVSAEAWAENGQSFDSVWVSYRSGEMNPLSRTAGVTWATMLAGSYFGDARLGGVIGQPFRFVFRTLSDSLFAREPVYLFRVIENSPVIDTPDSNRETGPLPRLKWRPFTASFPFYYSVTVFDPEPDPPFYETIVCSTSYIPTGITEITSPESLANGNYQWNVAVVDLYDNRSYSIQGVFNVLYRGDDE